MRPAQLLTLVAALAVATTTPAAPREVQDPLLASHEVPLVGVWVGEFRQYDPGRFWSYPMRLEVDEEVVEAGRPRLRGSIHWDTLDQSVTTFHGVRDRNMLLYTEDRLVQGKNIVLHGRYRASLRDPDTIEGVWTYPQAPERYGFGTFVLKRTALDRRGLPGERSWLQGRAP